MKFFNFKKALFLTLLNLFALSKAMENDYLSMAQKSNTLYKTEEAFNTISLSRLPHDIQKEILYAFTYNHFTGKPKTLFLPDNTEKKDIIKHPYQLTKVCKLWKDYIDNDDSLNNQIFNLLSPATPLTIIQSWRTAAAYKKFCKSNDYLEHIEHLPHTIHINTCEQHLCASAIRDAIQHLEHIEQVDDNTKETVLSLSTEFIQYHAIDKCAIKALIHKNKNRPIGQLLYTSLVQKAMDIDNPQILKFLLENDTNNFINVNELKQKIDYQKQPVKLLLACAYKGYLDLFNYLVTNKKTDRIDFDARSLLQPGRCAKNHDQRFLSINSDALLFALVGRREEMVRHLLPYFTNNDYLKKILKKETPTEQELIVCKKNFLTEALTETLYYAFRNKSIHLSTRVTELLIQHGADPEVCLHMNINTEQAELLLNYVEDINTKYFDKSHLDIAVEDYDVDKVALLLRKKANTNTLDRNGNTFLHRLMQPRPYSCKQKDKITLIQEFLKHIDINKKNNEGYTPLIFAIKKAADDLAAIELLLQNKADVNIQTNNGDTPLHIALSKNNQPLIELLLKYKANTLLQNSMGDTPLHICVRNNISTDIMEKLLKDSDTSIINQPNKDGETALFGAVRNGNESTVKFLLNKGADVNHKNINCTTVYYEAHQVNIENRDAILKILRTNGATL